MTRQTLAFVSVLVASIGTGLWSGYAHSWDYLLLTAGLWFLAAAVLLAPRPSGAWLALAGAGAAAYATGTTIHNGQSDFWATLLLAIGMHLALVVAIVWAVVRKRGWPALWLGLALVPAGVGGAIWVVLDSGGPAKFVLADILIAAGLLASSGWLITCRTLKPEIH